ncbi:MAG: 4Fe-4S binding protein [Clostridiales bacterium]|nr:4Fe-4S binding protein [Clostridiales bacterium]MDY3747585.1 4Fe-4S binding protein [Lachnospiraceae bacterium]
MKKAFIFEDDCVYCGNCSRRCPQSAIYRAPDKSYKVDPEKCVGCGLCTKSCSSETIRLVEI